MEQSQSKKTPKWKIKTKEIFSKIFYGLGRFLEFLMDLGYETEGASWLVIFCIAAAFVLFSPVKRCINRKSDWIDKNRVTKLADLSQLPSTVSPWDIDTLDVEKEDNQGIVFVMRGSTNKKSYNLTTFKVPYPKRVIFTKTSSSTPSLWIRLTRDNADNLFYKKDKGISKFIEHIEHSEDTIEIQIRKEDIPKYIMIKHGNRSKQEDV